MDGNSSSVINRAKPWQILDRVPKNISLKNKIKKIKKTF